MRSQREDVGDGPVYEVAGAIVVSRGAGLVEGTIEQLQIRRIHDPGKTARNASLLHSGRRDAKARSRRGVPAADPPILIGPPSDFDQQPGMNTPGILKVERVLVIVVVEGAGALEIDGADDRAVVVEVFDGSAPDILLVVEADNVAACFQPVFAQEVEGGQVVIHDSLKPLGILP